MEKLVSHARLWHDELLKRFLVIGLHGPCHIFNKPHDVAMESRDHIPYRINFIRDPSSKELNYLDQP